MPQLQLPDLPRHVLMPSDRELEFHNQTAKPLRCDTCHDTGTFRMWEGAPEASEVVEYACRCDEQLILRRWFAVRGIHEPFSRLRWADADGVNQEQKDTLVKVTQDRLVRDAERGLGIVLGGRSTTGKSMLASLMARYVLQWHPAMDVRVVTGADVSLLDFKDEERMRWWDRKIKRVPLLVFDGLGVERETQWVTQQIEDLFTYRSDHNLATIVVTRLSTEKVRERYGVDDGTGVVDRKIDGQRSSVRYASRVADVIENHCTRYDFTMESFMDRNVARIRRESDLGIIRPVTFG